MPKCKTIKKVLILGSGPIVIGQASEFDYSGTQAIKALREEGVEVILLNSNPATVMTDPNYAHRTYIEPITFDVAVSILEAERPDALLSSLGGQTALNLAKDLSDAGVLERLGVQLLGASLQAIDTAEDRQLFKRAMQRLGLDMANSDVAYSLADAERIGARIGLPASIRPSFTLGGTGGGIAHTQDAFMALCAAGLRASPSASLLIEESLAGYKEFELEVMRDKFGNKIVVCGIENMDPMGVHTGDSITVAPIQTLTDKEYQRMREASFAIVDEVGLTAGACNIQFGVHPPTGRLVVIEMNPRVSRSSALASKATGYPIAKIATKLALGYALHELTNDVTGTTQACFEPVIDYVVVKMPRFAFEKFAGATSTLTTSMRSVGEAMGIGRSFKEAYLKAMRSLELGRLPLNRTFGKTPGSAPLTHNLAEALREPKPQRPYVIFAALQQGMDLDSLAELTRIDPWFLQQMAEIVVDADAVMQAKSLAQLEPNVLLRAKQAGLCDAQIGVLLQASEACVRAQRHSLGIRPSYKSVDTCAAEFAAQTPYFYGTYEMHSEVQPLVATTKVLILGSGPIRIGQGVEFDCCCVGAAAALKAAGIATIMVNSNPETVSTDYDASDRLYFEPVTLEDVLEIVAAERPTGVIVQLGGQTPLRLAQALAQVGVPILGTPPEATDRAEDRSRFADMVTGLGLRQPEGGMAQTAAEAIAQALHIGYPVMVRPSYVLGGRAMQVVDDDFTLKEFLALHSPPEAPQPLRIDRYLTQAIEVDLDLVADGQGGFCIGGLLEHVEFAGVHSGDATCIMPPHTLTAKIIAQLEEAACAMATALGVVGLMNVQFAVQGHSVFVLEVNPRASRTVPFIEKATGVPLVAYAARAMMGTSLAAQGAPARATMNHVAVKEAVFPWARFAGTPIALGPEMRSTGEAMGQGFDLPTAMAKALRGAGHNLPFAGVALLAVDDHHVENVLPIACGLAALDFSILAPAALKRALAAEGILATEWATETLWSQAAGAHFILAPSGTDVGMDSVLRLRRLALERGIPCCTSFELAALFVDAMAVPKTDLHRALPLQQLIAPALAGAGAAL